MSGGDKSCVAPVTVQIAEETHKILVKQEAQVFGEAITRKGKVTEVLYVSDSRTCDSAAVKNPRDSV